MRPDASDAARDVKNQDADGNAAPHEGPSATEPEGSARSTAAAWNAALRTSLLAGIVTWVGALTVSFAVLARTGWARAETHFVGEAGAAVMLATVIAHVVFTGLALLTARRLHAWRPSDRDEDLLCFAGPAPTCSFGYIAGAVLLGALWSVTMSTAEPFRRVHVPGAFGVPAILSMGLALMAFFALFRWYGWLSGTRRLEVRSGAAMLCDSAGEHPIEIISTGRFVCVRGLTGPAVLGLLGIDAPFVHMGAGPEATTVYRAEPVEAAPTAGRIKVPGLRHRVGRWAACLALAGLVAGSVSLYAAMHRYDQWRWYAPAFHEVVAVSLPAVPGLVLWLAATWRWLRELGRPGEVSWLWLFQPAARPPFAADGGHVSRGRPSFGYITVFLLLSLALFAGVMHLGGAIVPVVRTDPFLVLVLASLLLFWWFFFRRRMTVRIRDGALALKLDGRWLPVTELEVESGCIVFSAGPLKVWCDEFSISGVARDSLRVAAALQPFCSTSGAPKVDGRPRSRP